MIELDTMPRMTRVGALLAAGEYDLAKRDIMAAIDDAKGCKTEAAAMLGVQRTMLQQWIVRLDLYPEIDALIEKRGYPMMTGAARTAKRPARKTR